MQSFIQSSDPAPPALEVAVRQFNTGDYYGCHETLEELWLDEQSDLRFFYQGILQVGAGLYHLRRDNEKGALSLLERGSALLLPFAPATLEIDVARLLNEIQRVHLCLQSDGPAKAQTLLRLHPPRIRRP